ncbi:MAG TPA: hemin uptake protein HemP [Gammaproteobacteria bacterium]|nr:hemin uptake protein HemP [Gammaproteobacteria bacterium]
MKNLDKQKIDSPKAAGASQSGDALTIRRMTSHELLAGRKELAIEHSGEEYRLRITSKGKLILTK